jgi:hypothetical protein
MNCCETNPSVAGEETCVVCGIYGLQVPVITAKALLSAEGLAAGIPQAPRFCPSPQCPVVYFDEVSTRRVMEKELTVPVFSKHPEDPRVLVCYCFGHTAGEVVASRRGDPVSSSVRRQVQAGHCACEVKNPKGSCCLGDLIRLEREE